MCVDLCVCARERACVRMCARARMCVRVYNAGHIIEMGGGGGGGGGGGVAFHVKMEHYYQFYNHCLLRVAPWKMV